MFTCVVIFVNFGSLCEIIMLLGGLVGGETNKMKKLLVVIVLMSCYSAVTPQSKALVNTLKSMHVMLSGVNMGDVQWTKGFWAERFEVCKNEMVPQLWKTYNDAQLCHSFKNFEIAAGLDTGSFVGPSFHDGDFYKTLEAVAALYALTKDAKLDSMMDKAITVIAKAQREDGYVYTKSIIEQQKSGKQKIFDDTLSFEAYNFGHLITAACVHYRATGKTNLLNVAKKAADFLLNFYAKATPEQARNAICPSHYMGIIELYRTTHDEKYLSLAKKLINVRGTVEGTDDNSDRVPFRQMTHLQGHAVRANYLCAGVADVFAETGDTTLLSTLNILWNDVVNRKMYITGGCGALYDGVSPDGTSYNPDTIQQIHQAYGRAYQLPNFSSHNETCANIGNLLWNWRMFQITGDAKYFDIVELELYNGILSGINLSGNKFFYTNTLAASAQYPYDLRWKGGRQAYIALSNCCPPNIVRTIAEVNNYVYSIASNGLYVNLYAGNVLKTVLPNGKEISLEQQTNYPWNGNVKITINKFQSEEYTICLRIPGWCNKANVFVNGKELNLPLQTRSYAAIKRKWKAGDVIELKLDMPVELMEANPLVEEDRNRVAVKRGPIVYCIESNDLPKDKNIFNIGLSSRSILTTVNYNIQNTTLTALKGEALYNDADKWKENLYQPISKSSLQKIQVTLIPYYAWANRGSSDMEVWIPFDRN